MTGTGVAAWRKDHPGPLRIQMECQLQGYESWVTTHEIPLVAEYDVQNSVF
jgi:hypothetical protein